MLVNELRRQPVSGSSEFDAGTVAGYEALLGNIGLFDKLLGFEAMFAAHCLVPAAAKRGSCDFVVPKLLKWKRGEDLRTLPFIAKLWVANGSPVAVLAEVGPNDFSSATASDALEAAFCIADGGLAAPTPSKPEDLDARACPRIFTQVARQQSDPK